MIKNILKQSRKLFSTEQFVKFSEQTEEYKAAKKFQFDREIEYVYGNQKLYSAFKDFSYGENIVRSMRRDYLNQHLQQAEKLYIPVLRKRSPADKLEKLFKTRNECPAVIMAREEFADVDIVIPRKWFTNRRE